MKYFPDIIIYNTKTLFFILISCVFLLTDSANAQSQANENKPVLRVIFSDDLKPWILNSNDKIEGVYPAIIHEIAGALNLQVELMEYPLKRCETMMEHGEADIIIGIKDTGQRKKYIDFLKTPYRSSSAKVFYMRSGEINKLNRFDDLYKIRVGTKLGNKYFPDFDDDKRIQKESVNSEEQNFSKLLVNRIDAVIIPEDRGEFLVSTLNLRGKVKKAQYQYHDGSPRFIGISKKSPYIKDIKKFNNVMKKISENGVLESLYMKHFFNKYNIRTDSFRWR